MRSWLWSVALRYTLSSASDRLVSFMSLVSISGLVLGVAVLVIVLSVMNGFERELRLRVLGVVPHGIVYRDEGFDDWRVQAAAFRHHPEVLGAAPFAEGPGLAVAGNVVVGVQYFGIDPDAEADVSIIKNYMTRGSLTSLEPGRFRAAIGTSLAAALGVGVGDRVTLVLPDAQLTLAGPLPRTRRFEVSALFRVGSDADKGHLLIHIDDANRLRRAARIDGIRIRVADLFRAHLVLSDLVREAGDPGLHASSWARRYGSLYDAIQVQKSTMFLLLLILVAVAAFNVVSNLVMTVDDKRGDIAILRTLGASPGAIMAMFVIHGALIGALGVAAGIAIGALLAVNLGNAYALVDDWFRLGLMDEYFVHYLPSQVTVSDLAMISIVSMLICLLATLYPARKAAVARPVEALSHDV